MALDIAGVLSPMALAEFALFLPCALVPDELQIVGKVATQPLVGAVGTVHAIGPGHILIGDGIDTELMKELFQGLVRATLLNAPDGLCQGVGTTPGSHVDRTGVVFVGQTDKQLAAR